MMMITISSSISVKPPRSRTRAGRRRSGRRAGHRSGSMVEVSAVSRCSSQLSVVDGQSASDRQCRVRPTAASARLCVRWLCRRLGPAAALDVGRVRQAPADDLRPTDHWATGRL